MPTRAENRSQRRRTSALRPIAAIGEAVIPSMPPERDWSPQARRWWDVVHSSAISSEWTPDDLLVVSRALSLVDDLALIETDPDLPLERKARLKIGLSAEMRLMESSLLLAAPFVALLAIELFVLPVDFFTFRAWEALSIQHVRSGEGIFYPRVHLVKNEHARTARLPRPSSAQG